MKKAPALKISQLTVNYEKTPVLWDISLEVPEGRLVAIVGPNGAGKSTLIKTALGLITPISGKIAFFGFSLKEVRQKVAYVPQRESVDWEFPITVLELVAMGLYGKLGVFRWLSKRDKNLALSYLEKVGMEGYANRQINQLSGGQQQRVFIARALLQQADLYFMDEPFSGIDVASTQVILNLLKGLKEEGKTVFVVHHDLESVASTFDWVILLNTRLVACGEVNEVFTPEIVHHTYGKDHLLFDLAVKLTREKAKGLSP